MKKVLTIVGPTAIGKSDLGVLLAQRFNGEIVSGDAYQVYRKMDIGTAKIAPDEQGGIVHHLLDIKDPHERFSVREYQTLSREAIEDITSHNKLPIIVGGNGLYIKATLYDYQFVAEEEADELFEELSNEEIYAKLLILDPLSLEKIHINNRRRLVRALNIALKHPRNKSQIIAEQEHQSIYDTLIIGLTCPREELYQRIDQRVDLMVKGGLLKEVQELLNEGLTFKDQALQGIGYKEWAAYFNNEASEEDCIARIKKNSRHFAKRQYTWFKHQLPVKWFAYDEKEKIIKTVEEWLNISKE